MSPSEKRAYGTILGAFVGDAAGAPLEFLDQNEMKVLIDNALSFSGGGALKVGPGQVTDDSEMAMCLLHALGRPSVGFEESVLKMRDVSHANDEEVSELRLERIQYYFGLWCNKSEPFDIG